MTYRWGELHELYKMTIPASYIGHKDFLDKVVKGSTLWIQGERRKVGSEDIINNYGTDYRVHLVRVRAKIVHVVQDACIRKGVIWKSYFSRPPI